MPAKKEANKVAEKKDNKKVTNFFFNSIYNSN
jgi:hypothetical protein